MRCRLASDVRSREYGCSHRHHSLAKRRVNDPAVHSDGSAESERIGVAGEPDSSIGSQVGGLQRVQLRGGEARWGEERGVVRRGRPDAQLSELTEDPARERGGKAPRFTKLHGEGRYESIA